MMPLTQAERDFLDAYVYEATHGPPFGGPATRELAHRDVYYSDLLWLLTAYNREGQVTRRPPFGMHNPVPPPSPWADPTEVRQRCEQLRDELGASTVPASSAAASKRA
jgi:hypothetical protein